MYSEPTVFVLGAGASWHYGYPTGETLVHKVRETASDYANRCVQMASTGFPESCNLIGRYKHGSPTERYNQLAEEFDAMATLITSANPVVIDFFLGDNPDLEDIGKFCIASVLISCKQRVMSESRNINRNKSLEDRTEVQESEDDWVRFVVEKIARHYRDDAGNHNANDVSFITFNYDLSLEQRIQTSLKNRSVIGDEEATAFLNGRVAHVYGKLENDRVASQPLPNLSQTRNEAEKYQLQVKMIKRMDAIFESSKGIRVMSSPSKSVDDDVQVFIEAVLSKAKNIYFLGFGFDKMNCEVLGLKELAAARSGDRVNIFVTNMADRDRVSKQIGRVLFGRPETLVGGGGRVIRDIHSHHLWTVEKSINSVYQALAYDFDEPD